MDTQPITNARSLVPHPASCVKLERKWKMWIPITLHAWIVLDHDTASITWGFFLLLFHIKRWACVRLSPQFLVIHYHHVHDWLPLCIWPRPLHDSFDHPRALAWWWGNCILHWHYWRWQQYLAQSTPIDGSSIHALIFQLNAVYQSEWHAGDIKADEPWAGQPRRWNSSVEWEDMAHP